jgi:hypothetical protein
MHITGLTAESLAEFYSEYFSKKGYEWYDDPWRLNMIGIRSPERRADDFDDSMLFIYKDRDGNWNVHQYEVTTDPGVRYLVRPIGKSKEGKKAAAILAPGQYVDAYTLGLHRRSYRAWVQTGAVTVYRDHNRDKILDFINPHRGWFGINLHKRRGESDTVGGSSAGCQVWRFAKEFDEAIRLGERHRKAYKNKFTYTLTTEEEVATYVAQTLDRTPTIVRPVVQAGADVAMALSTGKASK